MLYNSRLIMDSRTVVQQRLDAAATVGGDPERLFRCTAVSKPYSTTGFKYQYSITGCKNCFKLFEATSKRLKRLKAV